MPNLIILDGGTGRELARIGAPFAQPEWSALALIEAPHFVTQVHDTYINAGADVITTNSYAVVPFHIGEDRFQARGAELAGLAGQLARQAADKAGRAVVVAGSLPPVCGSYRADLFRSEEARGILDVLVAALRPFIDHWQAETLSAIAEAELIRDVIGVDGKPLWLSFTLQDETFADVPRLRSGETVEEAVRAAVRLGASAVLFNCSQPEVMRDAVAVAKATLGDSPLRVGVYANAFPPQRADAEANSGLDDIRADLTPAGYARFAQVWRDEGASIIGGCCGIGPEHIARLRKALETLA